MRVLALDTAGFPEVAVTVSVTTRQGRPVPGLTLPAFRVTEGGKPVTGLALAPETEPLSIGLAVDTSKSPPASSEAIRKAVAEILRELPPGDLVTLITFAGKATLALPATQDRAKVGAALAATASGDEAAIFDGLDLTLAALGSTGRQRMLLALTPGTTREVTGERTLSKRDARQVLERARSGRTPLYVVGLSPTRDLALLRKLAIASGGAFFQPKDPSLVKKAMTRAIAEARQRLRLTYSSPGPAAAGAPRKLEIAVVAGADKGKSRTEYSPSPAEPRPGSPTAAKADPAKDLLPFASGPSIGPEVGSRRCDRTPKLTTLDYLSIPAGEGIEDLENWSLTIDGATEHDVVRDMDPTTGAILETRFAGGRLLIVQGTAAYSGTELVPGLDKGRIELAKFTRVVTEDGKVLEAEGVSPGPGLWSPQGDSPVDAAPGEAATFHLAFAVPDGAIPTKLLFGPEPQEFELELSPGTPGEPPADRAPPVEKFVSYQKVELSTRITLRPPRYFASARHWLETERADHDPAICLHRTVLAPRGKKLLAVTFDTAARASGGGRATVEGSSQFRLLANGILVPPVHALELETSPELDLTNAQNSDGAVNWVQDGMTYVFLFPVASELPKFELLYKGASAAAYDAAAAASPSAGASPSPAAAAPSPAPATSPSPGDPIPGK